MPGSKRAKTAYWIFTILFCLMMGFTVYAQLWVEAALELHPFMSCIGPQLQGPHHPQDIGQRLGGVPMRRCG